MFIQDSFEDFSSLTVVDALENQESASMLRADADISNLQWITMRLTRAFPGSFIEVEDTRGDDQHLSATIVSPEFAGKSRIACHQQVYSVLDNMRQGSIHALALKTQATSLAE